MCESIFEKSNPAVMTAVSRSLQRILSKGVLLAALILSFILGISGYDASLRLSDVCEKRCDNHRSRGWTGSFFFSCETEYHNDPDGKKNCKDECAQCPEICIESNFRCPKTQLDDKCKNFCDEHRPKGNMDGYVLNCKEAHKDHGEITRCENKCKYHCPRYVCNPEIPNISHCPPGEFSKDSNPACWEDCEKYRDASTGDGAYTFKCSFKENHSATEKAKCQENCQNCPKFLCENDNNTRHCPSNYSPRPLPTTAKTTPHREIPYDGACKRRCDKYRLGGSSAYSFSCDTLFQSPRDFSDCLSDCFMCPSKICKFEEFSPTFHCPKGDNDEESKLPPQYTSPLCIFFLVSSLLFLLCFFSGGGILLYKRRIHFEKKKREIKRRFSKRVSFQVNNLDVPKEQEEPSPASSASVFESSPSASISQNESSA